MKNKIIFFVNVVGLSMLMSCATTSVGRVSSDTVTDLTGFWNDTDVKIVSEDLIAKCLENPKVKGFETKKGRLPVIIVGKFKNDSTEHIDTSIITEKMADAIINSGIAEFVADKQEREELREEKTAQNKEGFTSEESMKAMDQETAADFMLKGSVKTIVEKAGNKTVRKYYVSAQLIDLEKNTILWKGLNEEIKKIIKTKTPKM